MAKEKEPKTNEKNLVKEETAKIKKVKKNTKMIN